MMDDGFNASAFGLPDDWRADFDAGLGESGDLGKWTDKGFIRPGHAFVLVRASEMTLTAPEFLVKGLLETSALALMFGDPGCGKSFIALHLACSIATGTDFFGLPVKQGPVIYLAGEGHGGLMRRIKAWEKETGASLDGAPLFFAKVPARLLDAAHADAVAAAVDAVAEQDGKPLMIVIDTVARSFAGGDENSTRDMSEFVSAVDAMKARYEGCTALLVHHSGHADKLRSRGSVALKGALDAEYRVARDGDGSVGLFNTKMKDAAPPKSMHFDVKSVVLGIDAEGEEYGSAVLVASEKYATSSEARLSAGMKLGLDTFLSAKRDTDHASDPTVGIHVDDWRAHFYSASTADTPHAKKMAFQRARKDLVAAGHLAVTDDEYRILKLPTSHTGAFLLNRRRTGTTAQAGTETAHVPVCAAPLPAQTAHTSIDVCRVPSGTGGDGGFWEGSEDVPMDDDWKDFK
jgi:hypothetical protein